MKHLLGFNYVTKDKRRLYYVFDSESKNITKMTEGQVKKNLKDFKGLKVAKISNRISGNGYSFELTELLDGAEFRKTMTFVYVNRVNETYGLIDLDGKIYWVTKDCIIKLKKIHVINGVRIRKGIIQGITDIENDTKSQGIEDIAVLKACNYTVTDNIQSSIDQARSSVGQRTSSITENHSSVVQKEGSVSNDTSSVTQNQSSVVDDHVIESEEELRELVMARAKKYIEENSGKTTDERIANTNGIWAVMQSENDYKTQVDCKASKEMILETFLRMLKIGSVFGLKDDELQYYHYTLDEITENDSGVINYAGLARLAPVKESHRFVWVFIIHNGREKFNTIKTLSEYGYNRLNDIEKELHLRKLRAEREALCTREL